MVTTGCIKGAGEARLDPAVEVGGFRIFLQDSLPTAFAGQVLLHLGAVVDHTGGNGAFVAIVRWWRDGDVTLVVTSSNFDRTTAAALLDGSRRGCGTGVGSRGRLPIS